MNLVRLVYFSENRLDPIDGPVLASLQQILQISKRNNLRRDITGALVFDDLWFFQVLEGRREDVWATFRTILKDTRHDGVALVESVPVRERFFGQWSMRLTKRGVGFDPFVRAGMVRPDLMTGADIVEAVRNLSAPGAMRPQARAIAV